MTEFQACFLRPVGEIFGFLGFIDLIPRMTLMKLPMAILVAVVGTLEFPIFAALVLGSRTFGIVQHGTPPVT